MQSRCNGASIEHKFLYCQGEDVAGIAHRRHKRENLGQLAPAYRRFEREFLSEQGQGAIGCHQFR